MKNLFSFICLLRYIHALLDPDFSLAQHFKAYQLNQSSTTSSFTTALPSYSSSSSFTNAIWDETSQKYGGIMLKAAVGAPVAVLGLVGLAGWYTKARNEPPVTVESDFYIDRDDEHEVSSSVADTYSDEGFESKFEIGNDAAMWEKQADFSAN